MSWKITSAALGSPLEGTGATAEVTNAQAGIYTCTFTVKAEDPPDAKASCTPPDKTLPAKTAIAVKVEIGDVVRGTNLPNSLPPTKTFDVDVTITPSLAGTGHSISFDVVNGSANNGTASATANATRTTSGKVTITGENQTAPGNAGQLKIRARVDGTNECAQSNGFSVCAHPSEIGWKFDSILSPLVSSGKKFWGARYLLTAESDSGTFNDLDKTKISENIVIVSLTGAFAGGISSTSGFNETTQPQADNHTLGGPPTAADMKAALEALGNTGQGLFDQFFRFSCARCDIAENLTDGPKVPTSGFRITQSVSKEGSKHFVNVKKEGKANNNVAAGTVDDTTVKKAEVKD